MLTHFFKHRIAAIASIALAFVLMVGVIAFPKPTHATGGHNLSGWAWSSTIGWVSLNCATGSSTGGSICSSTLDYGVDVNMSTGVFTGYAWSSSIGWISFNSADVSTTCGTSAKLNLTTNKVTGWARAISGSTSSGWDGCISMSGLHPDYGVFYNPAATPNNFIGDAWGSTVVGWLKFYGTLAGSPMVDLKVNGGDYPSSAPLTMSSAGGPATLSWTSNNVTACTASVGSTEPGWTGSKAPTGATFGITVPAYPTGSTGTTTHRYTISCTPVGGGTAVTDSVYVSVVPTNAAVLQLYVDGVTTKNVDPGTAVTLTWTTQNIVNTPTCMGTSSPTYSGWNGPKASSATSTAVTYSYIATITAPTDFTINSCVPTVGGPVAPQTVHVGLNTPSCSVAPATWAISPTASVFGGFNQNFGTVWLHTAFRNSTLTASASPFSVTFGGSSTLCPGIPSGSSASLDATHQCAKVSIGGTAPTTSRTITITATPGPGSPAPSCTAAVITVMPIGSCTDPAATNYGSVGACTYLPGTGPRPNRSAPWIEF